MVELQGVCTSFTSVRLKASIVLALVCVLPRLACGQEPFVCLRWCSVSVGAVLAPAASTCNLGFEPTPVALRLSVRAPGP